MVKPLISLPHCHRVLARGGNLTSLAGGFYMGVCMISCTCLSFFLHSLKTCKLDYWKILGVTENASCLDL